MSSLILDPNFAYLLVVVGLMLTLLAILTPGTGVLEIGALLVWFLVGWQMYNLPINSWALLLLIIGVVPFIFVVRRYKINLNLSLNIISIVIGSVYLFAGEVWWRSAVDPSIAVLASTSYGIAIWVLTKKVLEASDSPPAHDIEVLLGSIGEARTKIHEEGSVYVEGEMWTASSDKPISKGSRVEVVSREGFILRVKPVKD